jgi:tetratricopeptide (TPR) repeat protein
MDKTRTLTRAAFVLLILAGTAVLLHRCVYFPYAVNLEKRAVAADMELIRMNPDTIRARMLARRNIDLLSYRAKYYSDVEVHNYLGMNYEILLQHEKAAASYLTALRHDERPEIYANLSRVQLRLGQVEKAVESLTRALRFSPLVEVPEPLRPEVEARLRER